MILENLLVCPVCQSELPLAQVRESGRGSCPQCGCAHAYRGGVFDFTPVPPPDKEVLEKWSLWEQLQKNGSISYTADPELNLSVGQREDAKSFADFCNLSGLVLDVGCGPQQIPSYGLDFDGQLVGIDPLRGAEHKHFDFVQGIGEYLPFRAATFDQVLFGTSLDHMLDPKLALAEARRVIKPHGTVNIWMGEVDGSADEAGETSDEVIETQGTRYRRRVRKAIAMLQEGDVAGLTARLRALWGAGARPSHGAEYLAELEVPEGAVDHFHLVHLNQSMVEAWLREVGLAVAEISEWAGTNNRFIRATPAVR